MRRSRVNVLLIAGIIAMAIGLVVVEVRDKTSNNQIENTQQSSKVTDDATGISMEGYLEDITGLKVTAYDVFSQEAADVQRAVAEEVAVTGLHVYDLASSNEAALTERVELAITIPDDLAQADGDTYSIYAVTEDGSVTSVNSYVKSNRVCGNVDTFGRFALVKYQKDGTPTGTEPEVQELEEERYAISSVNVRSGPDTTHEILGTLKVGEKYAVTGLTADNSWYRITYNDTTAYVIATSLSEEAPQSNNTQNNNNNRNNNTAGNNTNNNTGNGAGTTTPTPNAGDGNGAGAGEVVGGGGTGTPAETGADTGAATTPDQPVQPAQ